MSWRGLMLAVATTGFFSAYAAAQGWKVYTYPQDGFQIEFPAGANVQSSPIQMSPETAAAMERTVQYLYDGGAVAYLIGLSIVKTSIDLDKGATASFGALRCKTKISDGPLTVAGGRGRELRGTDCNDGSVRVESRYFAVGKAFYQVLALYNKNGDEAAGRHFVESFKLLPASGGGASGGGGGSSLAK